MPLSENEVRARSWHLSAQFCLESSPASNHIEYVRGRISACLQNMREKSKSMQSLQLLSFITPRRVLDRRNVPVFVILHCWRTIGFSTVAALLSCQKNDPIKFTVTSCTPLDLGLEIRCPDFTSTTLFIDFVRMSSKDTCPDVDPDLFLRVDIEGDSDAHQATIASNEHRCRSWTFKASFDLFLNPDLVDSSAEVAENIVRATLDQSYYQTVEKKVDLFSFAMPQNRSSFIHPRGMTVTGILQCKGPFRMRAVRSIFREREGVTVCWTPVHSGSGISTTSHALFKDFFNPANPDLLLRVDVTGSSDKAQPQKRGPKGPRKQTEPLHAEFAEMQSIMALPEIPGALTKRRAGRGASSRSACSLDETATPPPTPLAAAQRLASAPSVIPRRPPAPHTHRRRPAAQPCRRVPY